MLGVYGKKHALWYVFTGNVAEDVQVYKEFEMQAKKQKLPVKVVWGLDGFIKELKKLNKEEIWTK